MRWPSVVVLGLVALAGAGAGCERRPRPWDQPDARAPEVAAPPLPRFGGGAGGARGNANLNLGEDGGEASLRGDLNLGGDGGAGLHLPDPEALTLPVRVGGPWVRCYGGFHPTGEPIKDVTRLSLLCGPENGMRRLSRQPMEGAVAAGGPSVTESFAARRGDCYRVFAVAGEGVPDLDVVVRSSRGSALAADHGEDAWPIVQPDRPFCALEDDRYTVEVTARRGAGRFAAEIWALSGHEGREPHEPHDARRAGPAAGAPGAGAKAPPEP